MAVVYFMRYITALVSVSRISRGASSAGGALVAGMLYMGYVLIPVICFAIEAHLLYALPPMCRKLSCPASALEMPWHSQGRGLPSLTTFSLFLQGFSTFAPGDQDNWDPWERYVTSSSIILAFHRNQPILEPPPAGFFVLLTFTLVLL